MDQIHLVGGVPLEGTIKISGAKNAALPLMAACLLTSFPLILSNVPGLADIDMMALLLQQHGVEVQRNTTCKTMRLEACSITNTTAPYDIVRKMRASILVLGPLLARTGNACVSLPGGCAIGARPVDLHLKGLEALGARIHLEEGYIHATAPATGLKGASYTFPVVSVTGTENLMMAACLADGVTYLYNAAQEPEIADLADCLNQMGASIEGAGTNTLKIQGVTQLTGTTHAVLPDRIETGTYVMAAAITGGKLLLQNTRLSFLSSVVPVLKKANVMLEETAQGLFVSMQGDLQGVDVVTQPFPGFATDLQAQFMSLMTVAKGASLITETIFENRFMHAPELQRMGADISIQGASALVRGVPHLRGAPVMATDLRASVSLVLAGLAARGETRINRVYHLDRGYENVEEKLSACGAHIQRIRA